MPSPKRWFPVSRDLNRDHETWEFTQQFGDRALRTWLEVLAQLDAHDNRVVVTDAWFAGLSRLVRQTSANLRRQVDGLVAVGWLSVRQPTAEDPRVTLSAPKYTEYHRSRELRGRQIGSPPNRTYPNRTEPSEQKKEQRRGEGEAARPSGNGRRPFPQEFAFTQERKELAEAKSLNAAIEFNQFRDHHLARGTQFKDWDAAWRTWLRNAVKFREEKRGSVR